MAGWPVLESMRNSVPSPFSLGMAILAPYEDLPILKEYRRLLGDTKDPVAKDRYWAAFWDVEKAISEIRDRSNG